MTEVYDSIGTTYNTTRRADPRIEQAIWSALLLADDEASERLDIRRNGDGARARLTAGVRRWPVNAVGPVRGRG